MKHGAFSLKLFVVASVMAMAGCGLGTSKETRIARAQQHMARGDYQTAVIELQNVLSSSPADAQALLLTAQASLQLGAPERAEQFARASMAAGAAPAAALQVQADSEIALGHFESLLKQFDSGQLALSEPSLGLVRAQALLGLRRLAEASAAFEAVVARDPQSLPARIGLARVQSAGGDQEGAAAKLDELLAKHPESAEAWWVRATIKGAQGKYALMEQDLNKARELGAGHLSLQQRASVLAGLVEARLAQANVDGAAKAQAELNKLAPFALATPYMGARVALARQDYAGASETLTRLLAAAPEFGPARFLLGAAMIAQGHLNQAELHLARVVNESPDNAEARKLLAQVRMRLDRPGDAVQALSAGGTGDTDDPQIRALLGIAQLKSGDRTSALNSLERGLREKPDDPSLRKALVAVYLETGQKPKAIALLQQVLQRNPGDIQAHVGLAEISLRDGDRKGAIATLEDGVNRNPGAIDVRLLLQSLYLRDRQTAKADALAEQTLAQTANRADVAAAMGAVDMDAGRYDLAMGRFRSAVDRDPNNATYWLNMGRAQLAMNQPSAAESVSRALKLRPVWLPAVATMAMIELRAGRGPAALDRVIAARKAAPEEAGFALLEGDIKMSLKQYTDALRAYEAANEQRASGMLAVKLYQARAASVTRPVEQPLINWLDKHPDDSVVRSILADAYRDSGHLDKAIAEYERVAKLSNARPALLNNLAWAYFLAGDARAVRVAKDAYDREPNSPAISDTYGWILVETARLPEGLAILKSSAEAAPGQPDIQYHYASALARVGRKEEATERLKAVLAASAAFSSRAAAERLLADIGGSPTG